MVPVLSDVLESGPRRECQWERTRAPPARDQVNHTSNGLIADLLTFLVLRHSQMELVRCLTGKCAIRVACQLS